MNLKRCALTVSILSTCVLPAIARSHATSDLAFVASKAGDQVQISGTENSPATISHLTVKCQGDGWLVVRAHAQFSITDNGDGFTALEYGISLDHPQFYAVYSDATQARSAWELAGQILSVIHTSLEGVRIDPCKRGQSYTYYFLGAQNNVGDQTIAEQSTLVAEFFRNR